MSFPVICIGSDFLRSCMKEEKGDCVQICDHWEHWREGVHWEHWQEGGCAGAMLVSILDIKHQENMKKERETTETKQNVLKRNKMSSQLDTSAV